MDGHDNFKADDGECRSNQRPAFKPAPEWTDDTGGEDVVATATWHGSRQTGEDQTQEEAGDACKNGHQGICRDTECLPLWEKCVEDDSPAYRRSYEGRDVEEECVGHTDITH